MPETMSPREKVADAVREASRSQWNDGVRVGSAKWCNHLTNAILTALASSGDHAELARELRKHQHRPVGSLRIDMSDVRTILATFAAHDALIAEVAALREQVKFEKQVAYDENDRWQEAERKLAEAVGLLREWMGTWFVDADSRGENAIADDTRKFLSKEAERG
ncbi:hypothetical protein [uncultured Brevundimonas sp.]|uniref:hypothetical protein n=1 Tax=uncultured Brevundimonas sp. TaxID=213418 RepID=UPI002629759E|nr:hypothetical protein [uncultured Brevundimonas sp.]